MAARKKPEANLWAVIMAGGTGTRFWPESRKNLPKQFLSFFTKKSLLEETVARLSGVVPPSRILIVTQRDKIAWIRRRVPRIPASNLIGEPAGRNTAPCAILAAAFIQKKDPHAVMALLPADHHIEKVATFKNALKAASNVAAESGMPVTFGIKPARPHTGYGYLELGRSYERRGKFKVFRLKRFREKPSLAEAKKYYRSPRFLWNSGMFVWKTSALLETAAKVLPKAAVLSAHIVSGNFKKNLNRHFYRMPSISVDYGMMEKIKGKILTLPLDMGWNDLGSWQSLSLLLNRDRSGNTVLGDALAVKSTNNLIKSKNRLVVLLHAHNLAVVDAGDAVLVCDMEKTESIREVVAALENTNRHRHL